MATNTCDASELVVGQRFGDAARMWPDEDRAMIWSYV